MTRANTILREGKRVSGREYQYAKQLHDHTDTLCSLTRRKFVRCVHREDADFTRVPDPDCPGEIELVDGKGRYECPECGRTVYQPDKEILREWIVSPNISGIRDYVRKFIKDITDESVTSVSGGRSYFAFDIEYILETKWSGEEPFLPLLADSYDKELSEWLCIFDDPLICVLVDSGLDLRPWLSEYGIPWITVGDLFDLDPVESKSILESKLNEIVGRGQLYAVEQRAILSNRKFDSRIHLKRMGWREFEHCTQNLLLYSLGTSSLLGGTEPGSGVPDGAFTLHKRDNQALFMWDAKFVDLQERDQTKLNDEYDKIFRHLTEMDSQQQIQRKFGGVTGIVLFSPGIKHKHITRLAEVIHECEIPKSPGWSGYIAYFTLDALRRLYTGMRNNESDIQQKPNTFQWALQALLTSQTEHTEETEPDIIHSSPYNSVHVSNSDIERVFEYLSTQEAERQGFNREAYQETRKWFHTI